MGYIRTRANGQLALVFSWKGKKHTKGLGTTDEHAAEQIRQDANEQLHRIRNGESALASKLLADGHPIMDVLFGSEEIGHLIASRDAEASGVKSKSLQASAGLETVRGDW